MSQSIEFEQNGPVATLWLNRPEIMNAFDLEMAATLRDQLKKISSDQEIRIVLLRGRGRAFSAGGNIKMMAETEDLPAFFNEISQRLHDAVLQIRQMPQVVIAVCDGAVSGVAYGLVSACDLRFATAEATFQAGTSRLGLAANGSLTYFLPRLIGRGRAEWLVLSAERVSGEWAEQHGLANCLLDTDNLETSLEQQLKKLLAVAPRSQQALKQLLWELDHDLSAHLDRERIAISQSSATEDFKEGVAAFLEKRPARFQGK